MCFVISVIYWMKQLCGCINQGNFWTKELKIPQGKLFVKKDIDSPFIA